MRRRVTSSLKPRRLSTYSAGPLDASSSSGSELSQVDDGGRKESEPDSDNSDDQHENDDEGDSFVLSSSSCSILSNSSSFVDRDLEDEICKTLREQARTGKDVMRLIQIRFESVDRDSNGFIDAEEFRQLLVSILGGRNVSGGAARNLMQKCKIDSNGNGQVSYDEFVSFVSLERDAIRQKAGDLRRRLHHLLNEDFSGSLASLYGRFCNARKANIAFDEFRSLVQYAQIGAENLTIGELEGLMRFVDQQGKGVVDLSDLTLFLEEDQEESKYVVTDIQLAVQGNTRKHREKEQQLLAQGYSRLASNLNEGGRGSRLHLYLKRSDASGFPDEKSYSRSRVTDISLSRSSKDPALLALGYQCLEPYHVNQGAWFTRRQYLWIRRNADDRHAIIDVAVTSGRSRDLASKLWTPPFRGYKRIEGDLNAGNRGNQVFLWYFKEAFDEDQPHEKLAKFVRQKLRECSIKYDNNGNEIDIANEINLEEIWEKFDKGGKGYVSRNKLRQILSKRLPLKLDKTVMDDVLITLDVNHDGKIDKEEFMEFFGFNPSEVAKIIRKLKHSLKDHSIHSRKSLKEWFGRSSSGDMGSRKTAREFYRLLKSVGLRLAPEELRILMGRFDLDGDGLIDLKEVVSVLLRTPRGEIGHIFSTEANSDSKSFANVEMAARRLRSYARSAAGPDMDFNMACDKILGGSEIMKFTKERASVVLQGLVDEPLSDRELAAFVMRTGTTRKKLTEFCKSSTYIDAVLNMIVNAATAIDTHTFFNELDKDRDGRLSQHEFATGMKQLELDGQRVSLSTKELSEVIRRFDQDGDGEIDLEEFLHFIRVQREAFEASKQALLDEDERKIGDTKVLYVFSALRQLHQSSSGEDLFGKFAEGRPWFDLEGLEKGLSKVGIAPQEVQLSIGQYQQVLRRMDQELSGRVDLQGFMSFLHRKRKSLKIQAVKISLEEERALIKAIVGNGTTLLKCERKFQEEDKQGDGQLGTKTFVQVLRLFGVPRETALSVSRAFESEDSGFVNYEQFIKWADQLEEIEGRSRDWKNEIRRNFKTSGRMQEFLEDEVGEGVLSRSEVNSALETIGTMKRGIPREEWLLFEKKTAEGIADTVFSSKSLRRRKKEGPVLFTDDEEEAKSDEELFAGGGNILLTINYISRTMQKEKFDWKSVVRLFDRNGSGIISVREMARLLQAAGCDMPQSKISAVAAELSALRDGGRKINYEHFFGSINPHEETLQSFDDVKRKLKENLEVFGDGLESWISQLDSDGNERISRRKLAEALSEVNLTPGELKALFNKVHSRDDLAMLDLNGFRRAFQVGELDVDAIIVRIKEELKSHGKLGAPLGEPFENADEDGDGFLSRRDFRKCVEQIMPASKRLSNDEIRKLMDRFDPARNGKVNYESFVHLCAPSEIEMLALEKKLRDRIRSMITSRNRSITSAEMRKMFGIFDPNKTGKISRRKFQETCSRLGIALSQEELELLLQRFDTRSTGSVDYFEFSRFISYEDFELQQLRAQAGEHLAQLQNREKIDPVKTFEVLEGRRKPLGVLPKFSFHRGCRELGFHFSDTELAALSDLFTDASDQSMVKYRDFCLTLLAEVGVEYQHSIGGGESSSSSSHDKVWNPSTVESWLSSAASKEERSRFLNLQQSMARCFSKEKVTGTVVEVQKHASFSLTQRENCHWRCPVCFFQQTSPTRMTCEMCDSPCPDPNQKRWPHVKPVLDEVFSKPTPQHPKWTFE